MWSITMLVGDFINRKCNRTFQENISEFTWITIARNKQAVRHDSMVLFTRNTLISADFQSKTIATFPFGFKSQNGDLEN